MFVEPRDGGRGVDVEAVKARLAAELPSYMIPERVVSVPAMPLLPNGKIDRQALLRRAPEAAPAAVRSAALTGAEAELADLWRPIFRNAALGPHTSFAGLGGDSLSYVNAYLAVEQVLGQVPAGWTTLTLRELAALKTGAKRGFLIEVESGMVLRAAAITMVVASHFGLIYSGGAATSMLFWISGFLFGGLQLREVEKVGTLDPIARMLKGILVPVFVITGAWMVLKTLTGDPPRLSSLMMTVDVIDFTHLPTEGPNAFGGHDYLMWYVHCIVHILFVLIGLLLVMQRKLKLPHAVPLAIAAAVAIGVVTRFVVPPFFVPDFGRSPMNGLSVFGHSPLPHLATFALAALAGYAGTFKNWWTAALAAIGLAAYVGLSIPTYGLLDSVAIGVVAVALVAAPKMPLPRAVSMPLYLIAGASLFIYLLHFRFLTVVSEVFGLPTWIAFIAAVAGGVAAWKAWNVAAQWLAERWAGVRERGWPSLLPAN